MTDQHFMDVGPLMGVAMKELRGKVDGVQINKLLLEKVQKVPEED